MVMAVPAPPTGSRFAVVTPDDKSAPLIIVTILSMVLALFTFAIRIFIVKRKRHGHDDTFLGLAHLLAVGHWIAMFISLRKGLGKSLDIVAEVDRTALATAAFAGRILLMPTLCLSKISVLLVLRHLFNYESRRKRLLINATIMGIAAWGLAATIALSAGCSPIYLLEQGRPSNQIGGLKGVMITEMMTEVAVVGLAPLFLYSFDIALKTKLLVVSAFCFRTPLVPLSALYLVTQITYLKRLANPNSQDAENTVSIVPSILYQEMLICYALISATIPCMKSFVESFTTGGVSYVLDPNAGRIPTKSTFGSGKSAESEESYELAKVGGTGVVVEEQDMLDEVRQDGGRRISARLSRVLTGHGPSSEATGIQASNAPTVRKRSDTDGAGDVRLLNESV